MEPIPQIPKALAVIENVCEISNTVFVNKHQCKRIAERFSAIGAGLKWLLKEFAALKEAEAMLYSSIVSGRGSGSDSYYPAFDVLLRVLHKGETLVLLYSTKERFWAKFQDAIRSVVSRTDNREAFKEIHEELDAMKAQFDFESFSEQGEMNHFESSSGVERSVMLIADAKRDLEEMPQLLSNIRDPMLRDYIDMEKVTQVVSQKKERTVGADIELPIYLQIDLTTIEKIPHHPEQLHEYQNTDPQSHPKCVKTIEKICRKINSNQHPEEDYDWVVVQFGRWLGCNFALKTFKSNSVDRAGWNKEQLMKEVGSLVELRHPHIVQLVGFGQDAEECVFLMELMETDLRDFMKRKTKISRYRPFTGIEELDIITQIAKGMYYLHTKEYAHGDLKCSNILVNVFPTYFEVKISDLRNAQKLGKDWDPVAFKQAKWKRWPRCIAPEAINHYDDIEPSSDLLKKSDVFTFGITCYEVVTGKYPFGGISNDEVKKQINAGIRPELPGNMSGDGGLDGDLKGLIENCWDHDPNNRPDFATICHILEYIKSRKPVVSKWIPQVQGLFTGLLGLVFQANKSATSSQVRHELSALDVVGEDGLHRTDSGISVPAYLRIQPDKLKRVRRIGKGGFAKVYEATWLGCKVAAKTFETHSSIGQLQREVDFLIHLRHPYIVQLVGLCELDSQQRCSIVMEHMSGNLRELIESQIMGFTPRDTVLIISKIALGMAFLHFKGVMHRDLKSNNVLAEKHHGRIDVKIVDFGLSHHEHIADSTEIHGFYVGVGTGFWRAPEILPTPAADRSKKPDLKAADVYSFAMTCYEVLTGKLPFLGLRQTEYDKVISGHRPTLPSDLHPELKALVEQCWHGDPKRRPSFTEICKELQRIEHAVTNSTSVWESVIGPSWSTLALQCCAF